ncbi:MAG: creatininase family protein [Candidatus Hodarchaeales archaeon]
MKTIRIEEMNWPDIKEALEKGFTTVIVGIGSNEQHGPHLPTCTDALTGDIISNMIASRLGKTLQAPTINVGCSDHHMPFPGTISLRRSTLQALIHDYANSLVRHGFSRIIFIPSHGGNFVPLQEVTTVLQEEHSDVEIISMTDLAEFIDVLNAVSSKFGVTSEEAGAHAGETETSIMLALKGELVKKERFQTGYTGPMGSEETQLLFEDGMPALSSIGVLGDPVKATAEKGSIYLETIVDYLVDKIHSQFPSE